MPANSELVTRDLPRHAGIFQHQHAALGLLGADHVAGFQHQPLDVGEFPQSPAGTRVFGSGVTRSLSTSQSGAMWNLAILS